jgi:hypothetical protein
MVAYLEYALLLQYLSSLDSAGSSVLPVLLPGPAPPDARPSRRVVAGHRLVLFRRRAHRDRGPAASDRLAPVSGHTACQ